MRRFVLPPFERDPQSPEGGSLVHLGPKETKRLTVVLRLVPGDSFPGIDAAGVLFNCTIKEVSRGGATLRVVPEDKNAAYSTRVLEDIRGGSKTGEPALANGGVQAGAIVPPMPRLILAVAVLKGSKLDEVVRAATEAGVSAIVPLATERSVPRGDQGGRMDRYRRIAGEAIGQSGSATATTISPVQDLSIFARDYAATSRRACFVFHETPLAPCSLHRYCTDIYEEIVACIGPEGGFSDGEIDELLRSGFNPAWLGPTVLRAETAAVFALASLKIICLERLSWSIIKSNESPS